MTDIDLQCDAGNVAVNFIEALNQHAKKTWSGAKYRELSIRLL